MKRCTDCKKEKPLDDFERIYRETLETREHKTCNQCAARRLATLRNRRAGISHVQSEEINHWANDPWIHLCLTCPLPDCMPWSANCPINQASNVITWHGPSNPRRCKECQTPLSESNLFKKGDRICKKCKKARGRKVNERYNARMGSDFRIKHGQIRG